MNHFMNQSDSIVDQTNFIDQFLKTSQSKLRASNLSFEKSSQKSIPIQGGASPAPKKQYRSAKYTSYDPNSMIIAQGDLVNASDKKILQKNLKNLKFAQKPPLRNSSAFKDVPKIYG